MKIMANRSVQAIGVKGLPEFIKGADIAKEIIRAMDSKITKLEDNDIIIIAHKIVSKTEGRLVSKDSIKVSEAALRISKENDFDPIQVEIALRESVEVLETRGVLIVQNAHGLVCNFAGVDRSNAPEGEYILLPEDPDKSADRIRKDIENLTGLNFAVIIADTQGRPWRRGSVNIAIGCSGINAFKYNRGKTDLYGRQLQHSTVCQVDQLAAAAEPVMGQSDESIPVVIIRGYDYSLGNEVGKDIPRSKKEDLFR